MDTDETDACPEGSEMVGTTCLASCVGGRVRRGESCVCPEGMSAEGDTGACSPTASPRESNNKWIWIAIGIVLIGIIILSLAVFIFRK
jgi:hypothetical protein